MCLYTIFISVSLNPLSPLVVILPVEKINFIWSHIQYKCKLKLLTFSPYFSSLTYIVCDLFNIVLLIQTYVCNVSTYVCTLYICMYPCGAVHLHFLFELYINIFRAIYKYIYYLYLYSYWTIKSYLSRSIENGNEILPVVTFGIAIFFF